MSQRYFKIIVVLFTILIYCNLDAQNKHAYNWYFGEYAAINFDTPDLSPQNIFGSQMLQSEGCACISNQQGELLFYTNGQDVWDSTHNIMPNGSGLLGDQSACQSAVVVPHPGDENKYYLFTVDAEIGTNGIRYSIVDMTLNSGKGDVDPQSKNIFLVAPSEEKITAVKGDSNNEYWVLTHTWNSADFYAYNIDETGIDETPVISNTGSIHQGTHGYTHSAMKCSPDGNRLVIIMRQIRSFELFDFNDGVVSNPVTMPELSGLSPYGVEFSPNGDYVYITAFDNGLLIYQYDISSPDSATIAD